MMVIRGGSGEFGTWSCLKKQCVKTKIVSYNSYTYFANLTVNRKSAKVFSDIFDSRYSNKIRLIHT